MGLETFYSRMQKHIQDLCPFTVNATDVETVDKYCMEHNCNPTLAVLKVVFEDRFAEYRLSKRRKKNDTRNSKGHSQRPNGKATTRGNKSSK